MAWPLIEGTVFIYNRRDSGVRNSRTAKVTDLARLDIKVM